MIAVGSPFGLKESVTAGIISAKARGLGIAQREDFLQTDAAINPGNSGGPLVNLNGEIIGINTAISSTSGGYQGIGFAVPINLAKWVSNQLVTNGAVHRAFLGVQVQEVNGPLSKKLGLATIQGVLVTDVRPDSSGAKAGLNSGDVILEFDGQAVNTPRDLQRTVERADMAKQHTIIVMRDGQRATLTSDVAELPSNKSQASEPVATKQAEPSAFPELGLKLAPLTHEMANQLNLKSTEGVVITEVTRNSPADNVGLEAGMVIAKVGTTPVKTVAEFEVASKKVTLKDGLLLLVQTGAGSRYIVLNAE